MIRMPQRSVTRFFIPLIDVLTLLFAIFLLLPLVEGNDEASAADRKESDSKAVPGMKADLDLAGLQKEIERLEKENDQLRKDRARPLAQRVALRVLEIDPNNGKLYYRDPERFEIDSERAGHDLIEQDRRKYGVGQRELFYVILYPRERSRYPLIEQKEDYDRWFKDVAHSYDIPGSGLSAR
jgi:hypothetical protein